MKKLITLFVLLITPFLYSQTKGINYQAVIYNSNAEILPGNNGTNLPLSNKKICIRFSIIDVNSKVEYQETAKTTTDEYGMINLIVGQGNYIGGYASKFENIKWDSTSKHLKVDVDQSGECQKFLDLSEQPFSAVPFAFFADKAENVTGIVAIVNGGTGASTVTGAKLNFGLNNVDNTSDLNKPVSNATQTALNLKENLSNKSNDINLGTSDQLYPTQNAVKTYIDNKSASNNTALNDEIARAKIAELDIITNLNSEIQRATLAENSLKSDLNSETTNRINAINLVTSNLNSEITRAKTVENSKEDLSNKSTDVNLGTSDILYPSQNAVKTYVDSQVAIATPDATTTVKGKIKLAGDLTGTADLPVVQNEAITSAKIANNTIINDDIANSTIKTTKIDGQIALINGGTGSDMSNSAGYVKQETAGANFTTVYPIPATDVFGAIRSVNGALPNTTTGNVVVPFGEVTTGFLNQRPDITTTKNGDIYVVSGQTGANASDNGRTFISTGATGTWNEVTSNQASTDARYVQLAGSTMGGNLAFPTGTKITIADLPTSSTDVANKTYVDNQIASGAPNATTTLIGKVQLAGDLGGIGTTASAPIISDNAITTNKILDHNVTESKLTDSAVTTNKLADSAVTSIKIDDFSIATIDIANNAITTDKIKDGEVQTADIKDANVTNAKLSTDAVTTDKIKDGEVQTADIKDANVTTTKIASGGNNKVLVTDNAGAVAWIDATSFGAVADMTTIEGAGTTASPFKVKDLGIVTAKINDAAVTTIKIADANVTNDKLSTDAVTTDKIKDGEVQTADIKDANVTNAKLSTDAITTDKIKDGEVQTADIKDANVTTAKIADANVTTAKIASGGNNKVLVTDNAGAVAWIDATSFGAVADMTTIEGAGTTASPFKVKDLGIVTAKINDAAVTTIKIADANVTNAKLSTDAVSTDKIKDGEVQTADIKDTNVTNAKLSTDAVTTDKIKDGEVQTADIKDANVTNAKLSTDAVTTDKIKDGEVQTADIKDANVTNAKLSTDAVTTDKIKDGEVQTADIKDANVTTAKIADANVTNAKLSTDAITTDKIKDGEVQTADIKDANVTTAKIASGGNNKVLVTDNAGAVAWIDATSFGAVADMSTIEGAGTTASPFKVKDLGIVTAKINDAAVTTIKIADANVTNTKLSTDAVTTDKIKDGEIQTADIKDANVTNAKLSTDAVTTDKIKDGEVQTADIKDANVTNAKLSTDAITTDKIKDGEVQTADIKDANVTTAKIASGGNNKVLVTDNAGAVAWIDATSFGAVADMTTIEGAGTTASPFQVKDLGIVNGKLASDAVTTEKILDATIVVDDLANDAVETSKIKDLNVTSDKLADDAVSTTKIIDGTILVSDLANNAVETSKIKDLNVTTDKLADDAVSTGKILDGTIIVNDLADNAIETSKIKNLNVTNAKLATNAVTTDKIASGGNNKVLVTDATGTVSWLDNSSFGAVSDGITIEGAGTNASKFAVKDAGISTAKIVDGAITTVKIADANVTNAKLATDAVTTDKIKDGEVQTADIKDANVTNGKLSMDAVTTDKIKDGEVQTADIKDANVTNAKLETDAITTDKIKDGEVQTADIKDANVTSIKIADNAITSIKISNANVTTPKLADAAVTTAKIASGGNNKVLVTDSSGVVTWIDGTSFGAVADNITIEGAGTTASPFKVKDLGIVTAKIADLNVTNAKISADAITTDKIKNGEVQTADIKDANVTNAKLSTDAVTTDKIKDGEIQTVDIKDANVTNAKLASDAVTTDKILDGEVQTADIKDLNVTNSKLEADIITTDKIKDGEVQTNDIQDANITSAKLANNVITTDKIIDGEVQTADIKDLNVTNSKLDADAVTSDKILDGEVQTADIKDANITTAKIASGGNNKVLVTDSSGAVIWNDVTSFGAVADMTTIEGAGTTASSFKVKDLGIVTAKLASDAVTTDKIKDGEVQTVDIKDANVTTVKIADSNVTNAKLATDAVTSTKILDGTIATADLATNSVSTAKIIDANVTPAKIASGANNTVLTTDSTGAVVWLDNAAFGAIADGITITGLGTNASKFSVKDGGISTAKIADGAVNSAKILDGTIVVADIADNAIETNKIKDGNITNVKLATDAVTSSKILDGTIVTADLADNSISTAKLIDVSVTTSKIADAGVITSKIADNAITTAKIVNGTILNEDIADATITSTKLSGAVSIANGGTGATTATGALANLGAEAVANKSDAIDMGGTGADDINYPTQLAVKTFVENKLNSVIGTATQTALNLKEDLSNKDTNVNLGTSDDAYPSQNAVKTYVDTKFTSPNAISNLTSLPNISSRTILGNPTAGSTTPQEIPVTGTGDVVLKTSANIITPTITSPVLNGTISGTAIVPVKQGGSGVDMSSTKGYVVQSTTGANFSTVSSIPVNDVAGAVKSVNGVLPDPSTGNVAVILGKVTTGTNSTPTVTGTPVNSDIYVVSGQTGTPNDNGRTFIYDGSQWNEVATNISTTDNRYVKLTGSNMSGDLNFPTGNKITIVDAPTSGTDVPNKTYVDSAIAAGAPDATTSVKGKIQLAGDLTGTAAAPEIGTNKVTFAKMQQVNQNVILGRSSTGTGNIEALTTLPISTLPAFTGDVITTAGSSVTSISDQAVTLAKMQNLSAQSKLLGTPSTGGLGVSEIALGTGLTMTNGVLSATGGTVTTITGTTNRVVVTNASTTPTIDIDANYVGQSSITTLGTITAGTWNGSTISVANGGTGATTLTGYVKGNGTSAMTASATIPVADVTGAQTTSNLSTDALFATPTDTKYPSQLAVKTYVDAAITSATPDADVTTKGKIKLAGDLTGTAALPTIANDAINSAKILDGTIATADIATDAVTSAKIKDATIVTADLADAAITNTKIGETILVSKGGTGATTLTGYVKGNGTAAMTASATIPVADVTGAQTTANLSSNITTNTGSTTMYPSVAAVETYVSNSATPDATTILKGKIKLAGDLGGTADAPTVPGLALKAPLDSPGLTGIPTAPTATVGTNTTQIATTAFVNAALGTPFFIAATTPTVDALNNKTSAIERSGTIQSSLGSIKSGKANYIFEINAVNGSGPVLDLGDSTDSQKFWRIGAYGGINNFDTKARDLSFFSTAVSNALYLKSSSGYIGIGTNTPVSQLSNTKDAIQGYSSTNAINGGLTWSTAGTGFSGSFYSQAANTGNGLLVKINGSNSSQTAFEVSTGSQAVVTSVLFRVLGDGKTGIGLNTPTEKLEVNGNVKATAFIKSGGTSSQFLKADGSVDTIAYAPLASPTFTGTPAGPTAGAGTNTTQLATTEFVTTAVAAATIADATASVKGKIQLAGDLGGTADAPLVSKIQGTAVSSTVPTTNQLLQYNGTAWVPVAKSTVVQMETEEFVPTASQTSYTLTNTPLGKVAMYINGVRVPKDAVSVSGTTVTYIPASNAGYSILAIDRVTFDYIY